MKITGLQAGNNSILMYCIIIGFEFLMILRRNILASLIDQDLMFWNVLKTYYRLIKKTKFVSCSYDFEISAYYDESQLDR